MPVSIEDVLALLPELFPGTQEVPLANIRLNPDNPGPAASDEEIADLAANIEAVGLKNPVKLRPEPTGPLAPGVTLHPENPRLALASSPLELAQPKSGPQLEASAQVGRPWRVADFIYRLMSGQSRYQAFRRLQRPTIPAGIQNPTEEEAVIIGRTDNRVRDKGWWAGYQDVENLIRANPSLNQDLVAVKLDMSLESVNWAIRLLPLINPEARALIIRIPNNYNKGIWGISETALFRLTALGPGTGLKPGPKKKASAVEPGEAPIGTIQLAPPETQDLFYRALQIACDKAMTEADVKGFVAWIKQGKQPEDYTAKGFAPVQPTEGRPVQPKTATEKVSVVAKAPAPSKTPGPAGASIRGAGSSMKPAHPKQGPRLVASAHLSSTPLGGGQALVVPSRSGDGTGATQSGSAQGWWPKIKSFLLIELKRALVHLVRRWIVTALVALVVIFLLSPHLYVSLFHLATDYLRSRSVRASVPAGGQPQVAQPVPQSHMSAGGASVQTTLDEAASRGQSQGSAGSKGEPAEAVSAQAVGQASMGSIALGRDSGQGVAATNQGVSTPHSGKGVSSANPNKVTSSDTGNGVSKAEDPLKALGDGVKEYQSVVSTAGDAKSATDKVKGIFGF